MRPILAGIETEYGLFVEGRGAEDQIEDAMTLVRGTPDECFVGWDYRFESPRADLRGFRLDRLAFDPEDAKFDAGKTLPKDTDIRSDRVLANGARFYNDHGHPEYSTPEAWSIHELARHDQYGEQVVLRAAKAMEAREDRAIKVYKNNTDGHGASYGTHESYLVPREIGYERLFAAVTPMLVARQILTGAGKVGAELGAHATYQISQRADFFVEPANAETLYRRPIFNTRDEPHGDPREWIRMHVISGDANMMAISTALKVGLVKIALAIADTNRPPVWRLKDPVHAFQSASRDESMTFRVDLAGGSWTTLPDLLEGYFAAAEATVELDEDAVWTIQTSRELLEQLRSDPARFARSVDWAAKRAMLEQVMAEEGWDWRHPALASYDLEYHNVDPEDGLHAALEEMDLVDANPSRTSLERYADDVFEDTRARARSVAVRRFRAHLVAATWSNLSFRMDDGRTEDIALKPDRAYPRELEEAPNVGTFIQQLRAI